MLNCRSAKCGCLNSNFPIPWLLLCINCLIWKSVKSDEKQWSPVKILVFHLLFLPSLFYPRVLTSQLHQKEADFSGVSVLGNTTSAKGHLKAAHRFWRYAFSAYPIHYKFLYSKAICAKKCDSPREIKSTHTCLKATPNSLTWRLTQTFFILTSIRQGLRWPKNNYRQLKTFLLGKVS